MAISETTELQSQTQKQRMTDKTKLISLPPCFTKVNIFDNDNGHNNGDEDDEACIKQEE